MRVEINYEPTKERIKEHIENPTAADILKLIENRWGLDKDTVPILIYRTRPGVGASLKPELDIHQERFRFPNDRLIVGVIIKNKGCLA